MKDKELIELLHKKPDDGIRVLTEQYAGLVYAVVLGKLRSFGFNDYDIEECVAETISEFYFAVDKFNSSSGRIKSLICVMARNNAIDFIRKRKSESGNISLDDNKCEEISDEISIEINCEDKSFREKLLSTVKNLGEPDCEIIIRKFYLCQSSKEIAQKLDISVSNVDTRTHRAIRKLKEILGGEFS